MLKRQSLIALTVALVLGLVAVYLANTYLTAVRSNATPDGMTKVAVAAVPLDYGSELKRENIRFINYPADALPEGSFRTANDLLQPGKRRIVLAPIAANELILARKITAPGAGASIAALLPDGKRAVSVRINDVSGVAGFVMPNDSVDVLITRTVGDGDRSQQVTDVLMQNTRVIAMGQRARNEEGKPAVARTATLEVTPVDAQKLALGQQVGDLSLVLRKPGEQDDLAGVETVSLDDLRHGTFRGAYRPQLAGTALARPASAPGYTRVAAPRRQPVRRQASAPAPRPVPLPVRNSVDVVRGTAQTNYEVGAFGG